MCRQPQQKSGSKQPWSNWYDHQTEEATALEGPGRRAGREEGQDLCYGLHLTSPKDIEIPLSNLFEEEGEETGVMGRHA